MCQSLILPKQTLVSLADSKWPIKKHDRGLFKVSPTLKVSYIIKLLS